MAAGIERAVSVRAAPTQQAQFLRRGSLTEPEEEVLLSVPVRLDVLVGVLAVIRHVVPHPVVCRCSVSLVQADTSWALLGPGTIPSKSGSDNGVVNDSVNAGHLWGSGWRWPAGNC